MAQRARPPARGTTLLNNSQGGFDGHYRDQGKGVAIGTLGVIAVAQRSDMRSDLQSALDVMMGALADWSAIASMVFSGSLLMWLSFGDALGLVALAIGGLIAHELSTERVMHSVVAESAGAPLHHKEYKADLSSRVAAYRRMDSHV